MYSIPPCPNLAASTAAYRRRSFSDSQLKNRCIFRSTSAAYTAIPPSLIWDILCSKDTAAQAIREVILDHILSWQWRCEAHTGNYLQPFAVTTLLTAAGHPVNRRRLTWQRERLEKTLDTIQQDQVIAAWQYAQEHDDWPKSTILIEPPDPIQEQYERLEQHEVPQRRRIQEPNALGMRLKSRRQALGLSQIQAAEQLGLHQGYFSRLERGHVTPSPAVRKRLETWCAGEAEH